jgi:multisubunit Na+/H+ antiporter MnhF subunit
VTIWTLAIMALLPPFGITILAGLSGTLGARFVAFQLAASMAAVILILFTFATDQAALTDLGLTVVLLGLTGTLTYAVFLERWL